MTDEKDRCSQCCHGINRRRALELGIQTVSALGLLSIASQLLPACGTQQPLSSGGDNSGASGSTHTSTSTHTGTTPAGTVFFSFASNPSLRDVGGSIAATLTTSSGSQDVYITRESSTSAITVSQICTHQQCPINAYNASSQQYVCSCHGSIFSVNGSVIQGPASSALPTFPTVVSSDGVTVTLG